MRVKVILSCTERRKARRMKIAGFPRIRTHGESQSSRLYETQTVPTLWRMTTALTVEAAAVLVCRMGVSKDASAPRPSCLSFPFFSLAVDRSSFLTRPQTSVRCRLHPGEWTYRALCSWMRWLCLSCRNTVPHSVRESFQKHHKTTGDV